MIETEAECTAARSCLGYPEGTPFAVTNGNAPGTSIAIDRMWYPHGCFKTVEYIPGSPYLETQPDGTVKAVEHVHFNPVKSDDIPTRPDHVNTTIPICKAPNELTGGGSYTPLAQHLASLTPAPTSTR